MKKEIDSIKRQFVAFLIGFTVNIIYISLIIAVSEVTFAFEFCKTLITVITFLVPLYWILFAHYQTFKSIIE